MKLKHIKLFQAIRIGNQTELSVQNELPGHNYGVSGISGVSITEGPNGLFFRRGTDCTFTTWANVCYAVYDESQPVESQPVETPKKSK